MPLTSSMEDYLEAVLVLQKKYGAVRCVDVSMQLGVTKPSVSRAVKELIKMGYLVKQADGTLFLTDQGQQFHKSRRSRGYRSAGCLPPGTCDQRDKLQKTQRGCLGKRSGDDNIGRVIILDLQEQNSDAFDEILSILKCHPEIETYELAREPIRSLPGLEINPSKRKVFRDRQEIQLTAKEYGLPSDPSGKLDIALR